MSTSLWDRYAATGYDALRALIPYEELQRAVLAAACPSPRERLLVAGCGTGNLEALAVRQVPELRIDAVDFSPAMLAIARAKCVGYPSVQHHQADLCAAIPLPDGAVDVAVMCNVLYALPDQAGALREVARVLRPGGRLVLCDRQPWSALRPIMRAHLTALNRLQAGARWGGWLRTLGALPQLALVAAANVRIQQRYSAGAYVFLTTAEARALVAGAGFTVDAEEPAYAEQCWLLRATRQPEAMPPS